MISSDPLFIFAITMVVILLFIDIRRIHKSIKELDQKIKENEKRHE